MSEKENMGIEEREKKNVKLTICGIMSCRVACTMNKIHFKRFMNAGFFFIFVFFLN